jgi:DNA uptake protein ComE-like DNA-binding protein
MPTYRYGAYPRAQRVALLTLLVTASLVTVVSMALPSRVVPAALLEAAQSLRAEEQRLAAANFRPPPEAFAFDPNVVTQEELMRLGLSKKQAASWLKFRGDRDNAFRQPEDIGKLFVLSDDDKARLIPLAFVSLPQNSRARSRVQREEQWQRFAFDPNVVSPEELQQLGLSSKQAAAFVNYRSKAKYGRAFRQPEDIRRLGTLSDRQKDHLVSLADIPPAEAPTTAPRQRFSFDPNTISPDSLTLLGFPRWQAQSFAKYRGARLNTFRRPTDLRRVGALDSTLVEAVIPLVNIAPVPYPAPADAAGSGQANESSSFPPKAPPPALASFDINASGPTAWKRLPGIGSYRAEQVMRFRLKLGGFYSVEQVATTPGLPDSTFQKIRPFLTAGPVFRQIAINRASFNELKTHPYINRNLANVIVKNREKFGPFSGPEDLNRIRLITDKNRPTLLPYFSFE